VAERVYGVNHGKGELELRGEVVMSGPETEGGVPAWVVDAFDRDSQLTLIAAEYQGSWSTWHRPNG